VWRLHARTNRLLLAAVAAQGVLLVAFLGIPFLVDLLGGAWPPLLGWGLAALAVPAIVIVDGLSKLRRRRIRLREARLLASPARDATTRGS
jgi:hypothetical protein